jgi:hypothetical protein
VRAVEVADALPKRLVVAVAPAWVVAVVVAEAAEAAAVAEAVEVAAVEVAAAAVGDAGDEQFGHGTKTYEIEIKYYEATKNLFPRVCHCYVTGICIAGCARS